MSLLRKWIKLMLMLVVKTTIEFDYVHHKFDFIETSKKSYNNNGFLLTKDKDIIPLCLNSGVLL